MESGEDEAICVVPVGVVWQRDLEVGAVGCFGIDDSVAVGEVEEQHH